MTIPKKHFCPSPPRCHPYKDARHRESCFDVSTHWLYCPDGEPCPGGYACERHAVAAVEEYATKLGETWCAVPLTNKMYEDEHVPLDVRKKLMLEELRLTNERISYLAKAAKDGSNE